MTRGISTLSTCCIARLSPRFVVFVLHWSSPCCGFSRAPCASLSTPLTNPPTREHLTEDNRGSAHSKRRKILPSLYHKSILASSSRRDLTRNGRVQPQGNLLPPIQPRCRKSVSHIPTTVCAMTNTLSTSRADREPLLRVHNRRRAQRSNRQLPRRHKPGSPRCPGRLELSSGVRSTDVQRGVSYTENSEAMR